MGEEGKDTLWKSFRERIQRGNGRSSRPNPSSLIQFKSKVHFLKKGGGYLGEDLHGEDKGRGRTFRSPAAAWVGERWGEGENEWRKKKGHAAEPV
jgi:hypothetical protein